MRKIVFVVLMSSLLMILLSGCSGDGSSGSNLAPTADAGIDQTVSVEAVVNLDGSGSNDPDGDNLTYVWSITSQPVTSVAVLSDPTVVSPTFVADEIGTYVIALVVTDEQGLDSLADEVTILSENANPVADAGVDTSVSVGAVTSLDGSGSYDPDQHYPLTFSWQIISKPSGSAAVLSASDITNPTFNVDLDGEYTIELKVVDTRGLMSMPDMVTVTSENVKPVADAGVDQTVSVGAEVTLDGSNSYDPNGNYPLAYSWQITSKPEGSDAVLSGSDSSNPTFVANLPGEYTIQLTVSDSLGKVSDPSTVIASTSNSKPVADAGSDQLLENAGDPIVLDGRGSYDPDGDMITYSWGIASKPPLSTATFLDPTVSIPTFVADKLGTYVIALVVTDEMGLQSLPDEVLVTSENIKPVALACCNQVVIVLDTVNFDGSESYDVNLDILAYSWEIADLPKDSLSELSGNDTANPSLVPDTQGLYTIKLVVNDGALDSDPSTATILAVEEGNDDDVVNESGNAILALNELDDNDFINDSSQNVLGVKILVVLKNYLDTGATEAMLDKLRGDIGGKMDGCAMSDPANPAPDQNDWINNCPAQEAVYPYIEETISLIEALLQTQ